MKTPGISFVIPVYNMERYLPRVIQCLKAQTMPGFEAIFVNDGSRDNSLAICKSAASEDPRFRIIDQPNKGVAKARNAALDAARGEYVCFLDPDDWVESDMAQVLYEAAKKENADIVMFGIYNDYYDKNGNCVKTLIDGPALCGVYRGKPFQEHFDVLASYYLVATKMLRRACIEAEHLIDCEGIMHDQIYAQLKAELLSGIRYWFTKEEERELQRHNAAFYHPCPAEEVFHACFRIAKADEEGSERLSASDIFRRLKMYNPAAMRGSNPATFAQVLLAAGVTRKHTKYGNVYLVKPMKAA